MHKHLFLLFCCGILLVGIAPAPQTTSSDPQASALLPEFRDDLNDTSSWNRYSITAEIEPGKQILAGNLQLRYTNRDSVALDRLYFRLFPNLADFAGKLDITKVLLNNTSQKVTYEQRRYLLRINLPQPLQPGEQATINLDFRTTAPANAGRSYYGAFNLQNSVFALASAYPIIAMVQNGTWDIAPPDTRGDLVNSETALYDATLTAPTGWSLVTTGSAIGSTPVGSKGEKIRTQFVSGPQRDFMIVATRLPSLSADVDGTRVVSFYRADNEAGGRAALQAAVNSIQVFNKRFGRYPLAEFEVIPVDAGTFLGVEYPGLTLIEQRLYRGNRDTLTTIIAHEVAHQWWYSLVGNDVQREPWVDEALASYAQVIYAEEIQGAEAANAQLDQFRQTYRNLRAGGRDAAVGQPGVKIRSYYGVVYAKGALFFAALRQQIGDEDFNSFLKNYYNTHRYGIATGSDILASAEQACGCELDPLYRDWISTAAPVTIP
jgi:aminopeptidase N